MYTGFSGYSVTFGIINQIGTLTFPIDLTMKDAG